MKKIIVSALSALVAFGFLSCGSTSNMSDVKAGKPTSTRPQAVYTDWQGAAFGGAIPEWVEAVANAESQEAICTLLKKNPEEYKVYPVMAQGKDLDALKMLAENFDAQKTVANSISQDIANYAERVAEAEGPTAKAKITEQKAKLAEMVSANLTLHGLDRVTSYWTKYYMVDEKKKVVREEMYTYMVVMGISKKNYDDALNSAKEHIANNTNQDPYLRELASLRITEYAGQSARIQSTITANLSIEEN